MSIIIAPFDMLLAADRTEQVKWAQMIVFQGALEVRDIIILVEADSIGGTIGPVDFVEERI